MEEKEIRIPRVSYEGNEEYLKEQVVHYEKGTRRILIFTVVGLLMGWFSYRYYGESFLPLKILLAIPYKCSELLHTSLHQGTELLAQAEDIFFPQAPYVSWLAEYGTGALFGGAIYGSLAYFTGDKRVFTLAGYVRFGCVWTAVIGLWTAALFGANAWQVRQNHTLQNVSGFFIMGESSGTGYYPGTKEYEELREAFYREGGPREVIGEAPDHENLEELELWFGENQQGYMAARIDAAGKILVTDTGRLYELPEGFTERYRSYQEEEDHEALEN